MNSVIMRLFFYILLLDILDFVEQFYVQGVQGGVCQTSPEERPCSPVSLYFISQLVYI